MSRIETHRNENRPLMAPGAATAVRPPHLPPATSRYDRIKRVIDLVISGSLLVALAPLLLAIGLAIRFTSPGQALFRQERIGLAGRTFVMFKFRTMRVDADESVHREYVTAMMRDNVTPSGGLFKLDGDARVTRVGGWLRKTSLDELPQLINVVRGEMSLVGPRPALPYELALYDQRHHARFAVLPGITGLWQVSGRSGLPLRAALDLDVSYVHKRSPYLDLAILCRTAGVVLRAMQAR